MDRNENILEVQNLSVVFDGRTVVDNMCYALKRGTTLGIVGESGSGKSVSSLALMGLLPKQTTVKGNAWLMSSSDRIDLLALGEKPMRGIRGKHIGMIFQEPMTSLNPVQRCGDQVMEMLRLHEDVSRSEARQRVLDLFGEVSLPRPEKIFTSYPHEISGGQKQRVMIAMALICKPDILIADEPTTALDVTVQKTILDLLHQLQRRHGISVIFITHDLGVVAQVADEVVVMYHGKIVEQGAVDQVLRAPQHPYTQGLLACRPPLDERPHRLHTVADFMEHSGAATSEQPIVMARPQEQGTPLLQVRGLTVSYPLKKSIFGKVKQELHAVDNISFDLYRGETLGLVGESGCGKTTLGRALMRLVDSQSGSITFDGKRLDTLTESQMRRVRSRIQIIFQDPYSSLNPSLTVGDAIAEPLRLQRRGRDAKGEQSVHDQVVELLERVGLDASCYNRYPHQFSGGQRQRICIARALILNPELVICDESVSALDVSVQAQVLNLLNDLKDHYHYTYIFISHDLSVVHYISNRILVMQQGRLVELADADELYHNPQQPYTRSLLDAIPKI